jgi:cytochrome c oxidase subunit 2
LSALEPEGPAARGAATLWWVMFWGSAAIFLWVSAALLLAVARPAGLRALGPQRTLAWGGVVIPLAVLTALVVSAFALGERLLAHPREPAPLRIEAVARQWAWEFRYPGGRTTTDALHLPMGRDVDFAVVSADVIHSFWIPRLGGKIDAIPGHENVVRLRADRAGAYGGICAEFCGAGHAAMRFSVEAHEREAFEALTGEGGE